MTTDDAAPGYGAEDAYLQDLAGVAALRAALGAGVVGALAEGPATLADLVARTGRAEAGLNLLAGLMEGAGLVERRGERIALAPGFAAVWRHRRGLLEQKLAFLERAVRDVHDRLPELLFDMAAFQRASGTFGFFRYDRAMDVTPEALAATAPWVDYVTALSEAEAPLLVPRIDLSGARRLLEIGGNTGVMAEALVEATPGLTAVVMDLPAVAALGERRMAGRPAAARIGFVAGDARTDPWPGPVDAVLFKSVLHDWPEADAARFLARAAERLAPGGRIVICERAAFEPGPGPLPLSMLANLVFAPFYRGESFYRDALTGLGLECSVTISVPLDLDFQIIEARKIG